MVDTQRADVRMAEFLGGNHAGMAGDDRARLIDSDDRVEPKLRYRSLEPLDFLAGMFLGLSRVGLEVTYRPILDTRIVGEDARLGLRLRQSSLDGARERTDAVSYGRCTAGMTVS